MSVLYHLKLGLAFMKASLYCRASSVYFCFCSASMLAHHSPKILVMLRFSKCGYFCFTTERCLLQKIKNAFMGRFCDELSELFRACCRELLRFPTLPLELLSLPELPLTKAAALIALPEPLATVPLSIPPPNSSSEALNISSRQKQTATEQLTKKATAGKLNKSDRVRD